MNYQTLINSIQSNIYNNGNNEITGDLLQQVLISMITALGAGYQFAGIATPSTNPGTPDERTFYLGASGTYPNFGSAVIQSGELAVFYYDSSWHSGSIPFPIGDNAITTSNINNGAVTEEKLATSLLAKLLEGSVYFGVATPSTNPGTPDKNGFYLTSAAGTYVNFNNLVVGDAEIAILKFDSSLNTWQKDSVGIPEMVEIVNNLSSGGIDKALSAEMGKFIGSVIGSFQEANLNNYVEQNCSLGSNNWYGSGKHKAIPVSPGDSLKLTMVDYGGHTTGNYSGWYVFVTSSYNPPYSDGDAIPKTGSDNRLAAPVGVELSLTAPNNAAYLIITTKDGAGISPIWKVAGAFEPSENLTDRVSVLEDSVEYLSDIVGGEPTQIEAEWSEWQSSPSTPTRGYKICLKTTELGGVVTVKFNNYNTYKIGVVIQSGTGWTGTVVSDTGWKTNDIIKTIAANEVGFNIRVSVGRIDNGNVNIADLDAVVNELSFVYTAGAGGLVTKVENIEKELSTSVYRIPIVKMGGFEYVGKKIDVSEHRFSISDIGVVTSPGTARQGFAIFGDYLFQCHNTNNAIVVFKLSTGQTIQTISLTANSNNHANSATFGNQYYGSSDPFPCLYISSEGESKVYVYRITGTEGAFSASLIQTLSFSVEYFYPNLHVDAPNNRGIVVGYKQNSWQSASGNNMVACCFNLPYVTAGDKTLSNPYNEFTFPFLYAAQGAFGKYGKLYAAFGNTYDGLEIGGIVVIDYILKNVESFVDLKAGGNFEPEGVGWWDDALIITTQYGEVKKITF